MKSLKYSSMRTSMSEFAINDYLYIFVKVMENHWMKGTKSNG